MIPRLSRRIFLMSGIGAISLPERAFAQNKKFVSEIEQLLESFDRQSPNPGDLQYFDPELLPPAEAEIDYPIEAVSSNDIAPRNRRQIVQFDGVEPLGSIVVDPEQRFLFHIIDYGQALRYGVGVGRAGFGWSGTATIGMKRRWPRWVPSRSMVDRDRRARRWLNGQPGGPENPLGARALYLFADGKDTLYRIHGTNEPTSIGKAVSSGCIRMLNQDVAELFDRVEIGTTVYVRPSTSGDQLSANG